MSNYILGGGIAGLISAFYEKDYMIIGSDIGGQMAQKGLGPRILEVNDYSSKLLEDVGYDIAPIKTAKIGYRYDNRLNDQITEHLKTRYYLKSRNLSDVSSVPSSIMSDGKNTIKYYDIDWDDLIQRLYDSIKDRYIIANITEISVDKKTLTIQKGKAPSATIEYNKLISTLPAPVFYKLTGLEPDEELKTESKFFVIVPASTVNIGEYDYVYYPCVDAPYHRITKISPTRAVIEYTGNHFKSADLMTRWRHVAITVKTLPSGQITGGKVKPIKDIEFLGRFAEWNHDIKTDDIVKRYCHEGEVEKNGTR